MTSPLKDIKVLCPSRGIEYDDWMRGSINLELDDFDEEYIDQATSSTYPECNLKVYHQSLIVREDGVWEMRSPSA
jgi:hypothetical protein